MPLSLTRILISTSPESAVKLSRRVCDTSRNINGIVYMVRGHGDDDATPLLLHEADRIDNSPSAMRGNDSSLVIACHGYGSTGAGSTRGSASRVWETGSCVVEPAVQAIPSWTSKEEDGSSVRYIKLILCKSTLRSQTCGQCQTQSLLYSFNSGALVVPPSLLGTWDAWATACHADGEVFSSSEAVACSSQSHGRGIA